MEDMPSMEPDDFATQELPSTTRTTNRATKGRGKGKTTTTTVTRQILTGDDEEESDERKAMTFSALFDPGPDDSNNEMVTRVRVFRSEPREGVLGYIEDMDATETYIKEQWGGSTYRLEGVNHKGRIIRVRTIVIGGDPIFVGEAFESQWRRQRGLPAKSSLPAGDSMSMKDMLAVIEAREVALRKELADKEARDRAERQEREESRRRDEREWQTQREQAQREFDERQRRQREEDDRRRRQEEDDRETRRRHESVEAATRSQQFMTQMLSIVQSQASNTIAFVKETLSGKPSADPTAMLMQGVTLALKLKEANGDGEDGDLLTTVVKNLPDMLNSAGNAVGKAIREVRGQPASPSRHAPANNEGGLTLPPGPVSNKFTALVNRISAAGGDPEQALSTVADRLLASTPSPRNVQQQPAPASPGPIKTVFDMGPPSTTVATPPATENPQSTNSVATPVTMVNKVVTSSPVEGVTRMSFGRKVSPPAPKEGEAAPVVP